MPSPTRSAGFRPALAVLHPGFALTGVLQAIGGTLLPSLAAEFHLNDAQSGALFLLYFAGTSLGAFFCRSNYARSMAFGFLAIALCCFGIAAGGKLLLGPLFLLLGISVGVPMSGVSLFVGRAYPQRCAPMLASLNFSWSVGALVAPLLAGRILLHHSYRTAYDLLALVALVMALAFALFVRDAYEAPPPLRQPWQFGHLQVVVVFAFAAFLQVGIENTSAAWLSTYLFRTADKTVALAATATAFYWVGFVSSRGVASFVLMRFNPARVFRAAVAIALLAAMVLAATPPTAVRHAAMFLLGAALAPIYPLIVAGSLTRARHTSDSRWVLATAGFGGSVLPWCAGFVSQHTGSIRAGILTIPAALIIMVLVLPTLTAPAPQSASSAQS